MDLNALAHHALVEPALHALALRALVEPALHAFARHALVELLAAVQRALLARAALLEDLRGRRRLH